MTYVAPQLGQQSFHCPRCNVFSHQDWFTPQYREHNGTMANVPAFMVSRCVHCRQYSYWVDSRLVVPDVTGAPLPHPETPDPIKVDYDEARSVFARSPRSSAALLRLCIQKLCLHFGLPGKNLNGDIGELVKAGLPVQIQRSLDIVRVIGNNQVHPGVLDISDDPETATRMFELVNLIVEDRIARPKQIEELYLRLPEGARKQIEQRDAQAVKAP